jgi:peptidoglycan/xylan/chitin deacetylase (PgdA/CDA1 family)
VIAWSIRPFDTTVKDKQKLLASTENKLHAGGILLLHERSEITTKTLPEMIRLIQSRGYAIVSLETLINTGRS